MPETRRLAAIMFTDFVRYTALMGSDEANAMQLVRRNRDIQKPLIEKHEGTWLKEMGDGIIASFQTASDAIYCAMEIQKLMISEKDIKLRIGIHLANFMIWPPYLPTDKILTRQYTGWKDVLMKVGTQQLSLNTIPFLKA